MTRSYRRMQYNARAYHTDYTKQVPLLINGNWFDLTHKEEETLAMYKRKVYTNIDGQKKHGQFLLVKEGETTLFECPKHGITRGPHGCDWSEKYKPKCKTLIKYEMLTFATNQTTQED